MINCFQSVVNRLNNYYRENDERLTFTQKIKRIELLALDALKNVEWEKIAGGLLIGGIAYSQRDLLLKHFSKFPKFKALYQTGADFLDVTFINSEKLTTVQRGYRSTTDIIVINVIIADLLNDFTEKYPKLNFSLAAASTTTTLFILVSRKMCKEELEGEDYLDLCGETLTVGGNIGFLQILSNYQSITEIMQEAEIMKTYKKFLLSGASLAFGTILQTHLLKDILRAYNPHSIEAESLVAQSQQSQNLEREEAFNPEKVFDQEKDDIEDKKDKHQIEREKLLKTKSIEEWKEIPQLFHRDPELIKFKCPISEKVIRYIIVIKKTENATDPIFYEKGAIHKWLADNPSHRPVRWPQHIEYKKGELVEFVALQKKIDERLQGFLEEFSKYT